MNKRPLCLGGLGSEFTQGLISYRNILQDLLDRYYCIDRTARLSLNRDFMMGASRLEREKRKTSFLSHRFWVGITISLFCLWLAIRNVAWAEVRGAFENVNMLWFALAIPIQMLSVGTRAQRWRKLLEGKVKFPESLWGQGIHS